MKSALLASSPSLSLGSGLQRAGQRKKERRVLVVERDTREVGRCGVGLQLVRFVPLSNGRVLIGELCLMRMD